MAATPEQIAAAEAQIVEQSKRIEFYITEYSVELLAQKMQSGKFEIPSYEREDTWEPAPEVTIHRIALDGTSDPVPLLLGEPPNRQVEIVDGSQRLRTIHQFILSEQFEQLDELLVTLGASV